MRARRSTLAPAISVFVAGGAAFTGCARGATAPSAWSPGPTPSASAIVSTAPPPVRAAFVDLTSAGTPVSAGRCETLVVAAARGRAVIEPLSPAGEGAVLEVGDTWVWYGYEPRTGAPAGQARATVRGQGFAFVAHVRHAACDERALVVRPQRLIPSSSTAPLTWAHGAMRAHLDLETNGLVDAYVGRLEGTVGVVEHTHDEAWEILGDVEGTGTFTFDGAPHRLGPRGVVVVPPGTRHAWLPDEGTRLVAIQMYAPPGPEQRFKLLANGAIARDAGAR
jgi:mannose-6-phosphate isomerase-like protein (cupin superfamily)